MAQTDNSDIKVLVGVEGGVEIDRGSGRLISKTLNSIAKNISRNKTPNVTFDVDYKKTSEKVSKQLNKIIKSIKFDAIVINVKTNDKVSNDIKETKAKTNTVAYLQEGQKLEKLLSQKNKDIEATKQQAEERKKLNKIFSEFSFLGSIEQSTKYNSILNNTDKLGLKELTNDFKVLEQSGNELNATLKSLIGNISGMSIEDFSKKFNEVSSLPQMKELLEKTKEYHNELQRIDKLSKKDNSVFVENTRNAKNAKDLENLITTMIKYGQVNDKFKNKSGLAVQFDDIVNAAKALKKSGAISGVEIDKLRQRFVALDGTVTELGLKGQTAFGRLRAQMEKLGVYFSASTFLMGAVKQIKNITNSVIELDAKVTDLQIATGGIREETEKLIKTYSQMGKQLGATPVDVANAADSWLRQGYSVAETNTLIKNSMMLSKLGQIDSAESTKALTSAMKGYKLSVEESIGVVDKFTALDMEAAVSAGYIATAMAETATGARLAGIEMDRLAGYVTQVGEVTQDGAESVGTFFKTLFARMGNIKEGKLIDPETQEDLSSVEITLGNLGIKLRENGGQFRNFGKILDEVYAKWDKLGSVNQRALAVAFSGVRNQEKFLTLMDNYGQAMEYAEIAASSAGTALDKYENSYLVSVEAAQNRFTAQFGLLSKAILNSDLITNTYDAGTGLLGFLTDITETLGTIPTLATVAAGALSSIGNRGWLTIVERQIFKFKYAQPLLEFALMQAIVGHVLKYEESVMGIDYPMAG